MATMGYVCAGTAMCVASANILNQVRCRVAGSSPSLIPSLPTHVTGTPDPSTVTQPLPSLYPPLLRSGLKCHTTRR